MTAVTRKDLSCHIGGLELANAFGELTDANEQKTFGKRWLLRQKLGKKFGPWTKILSARWLACLPKLKRRQVLLWA